MARGRSYYLAPPEEFARVGGPTRDPAELVREYQGELALSHHYLDGLEQDLRLRTPPDAHVPDRLDIVQKTIAGGVLIRQAQLVGILGGAIVVGIVIGYIASSVMARRRAAAQAEAMRYAQAAYQAQVQAAQGFYPRGW